MSKLRRKSVKRRTRRIKSIQKGGQNTKLFTKFPKALSVFFNRTVDGGIFTKEETVLMPTINWTQPPRTNTYHTYICFDPDATMPAWIHLLVVNCTTVSLDSGISILNWEPPNPPKGTGEHRYIFGLYSHVYPVSTNPIANRGAFNLQEYIDANGLVAVAGAHMKVVAEPA